MADAARWDPAKHPRIPGGHGGGEFTSKPGTGAARPKPPPGTRWYHGSQNAFEPGQYVNPRPEPGKPLSEGTWTYLTTDKLSAYGLGGSHVHEVRPLGPVEPDPHETQYSPGVLWRTRVPLKVVKRLSPEEIGGPRPGQKTAPAAEPPGTLAPKGRFTMRGVPPGDPLWGKLNGRLATPQQGRGPRKGEIRRPALPPYQQAVAQVAQGITQGIADQGTLDQGRKWYQAEHDLAVKRAARYKVPVQVAAAVEAATSPRTNYATNQRVTNELLDVVPRLGQSAAELAASRRIGGAVMTQYRNDAVAITLGAPIGDRLTGPKRRAYYDNIMWPGQTEQVTVDAWMLRSLAALGLGPGEQEAFGMESPKDFPEGVGRMLVADATRAASDAYRARGVDAGPDAVQAAYWIAAQKQAGIKDPTGRSHTPALAAAGPGRDPEVLTDAEYDAELLLDYLAWLAADIPGRINLGPPASARADGTLAADNPAAWPIAQADPRWKGLGMTPAQARQAAGGTTTAAAMVNAELIARLNTGLAAAAWTPGVAARWHFNPRQPRVPHGEHGGQWTKNPAPPGPGVARRVAEWLGESNTPAPPGPEFTNLQPRRPGYAPQDYPGQWSGQLGRYAQGETGTTARRELGQAAYWAGRGDFEQTARSLRDAAGQADKTTSTRRYLALADRIDGARQAGRLSPFDWHADYAPPRPGGWTPDLTPAHGVKALTSRGRPDGAGTADDPVDVQGNLDRALILMHQGKHVRLNQVDEVALLLRKVEGISKRAAAKDTKPPDWDFGLLTVKGTNLFTAQHRGIPRIDMPQFSGLAQPGTAAAAKAGGAGKFADMTGEFAAALAKDGITVTDKRVPVARLRATQTELVGSKVAGFAAAVERGDAKAKATMAEPIYVTRDWYVIDGHHRWAANMMLDALNGTLGDDTFQNVHMVDMDIGAAIPYANAFAQRVGIAASAAVSKKTAAAVAAMRADLELRLAAGLAGGPHPKGGDGLTAARRDLAEHPVDVAAVKLRWDPVKHPRVKHGHGGGEFTRVPHGTEETALREARRTRGGDVTTGLMQAGQWQQGYQAQAPAPAGVLPGGRSRYVTVGGQQHLIDGAWTDPWWMAKPGGGTAISRRWQSKAQNAATWEGGKVRQVPIPAMDERVLTEWPAKPEGGTTLEGAHKALDKAVQSLMYHTDWTGARQALDEAEQHLRGTGNLTPDTARALTLARNSAGRRDTFDTRDRILALKQAIGPTPAMTEEAARKAADDKRKADAAETARRQAEQRAEQQRQAVAQQWERNRLAYEDRVRRQNAIDLAISDAQINGVVPGAHVFIDAGPKKGGIGKVVEIDRNANARVSHMGTEVSVHVAQLHARPVNGEEMRRMNAVQDSERAAKQDAEMRQREADAGLRNARAGERMYALRGAQRTHFHEATGLTIPEPDRFLGGAMASYREAEDHLLAGRYAEGIAALDRTVAAFEAQWHGKVTKAEQARRDKLVRFRDRAAKATAAPKPTLPALGRVRGGPKGMTVVDHDGGEYKITLTGGEPDGKGATVTLTRDGRTVSAPASGNPTAVARELAADWLDGGSGPLSGRPGFYDQHGEWIPQRAAAAGLAASITARLAAGLAAAGR